jgi:hypothetical protein
MKTLTRCSLLLFVCSLFFACDMPTLADPEASASGSGRVLIRLGDPTARTIMPTDTPNFTKVELECKASGKATVTKTLNPSDTTELGQIKGSGYPVALENATWTITATCYTGDTGQYLAAKGTLSFTVNGGGGGANISVQPIAISDTTIAPGSAEKKGLFAWTIDKGGVTASGGTVSITEQTLTPAGGATSIDLGSETSPYALEPGYYDLKVTVSNGSRNASVYHAVHIYSGLTTDATSYLVFDDAMFVSLKKIAGTIAVTGPMPQGGTEVVSKIELQPYSDPAMATVFTGTGIDVAKKDVTSGTWNFTIPVTADTVYFKVTITTSGGTTSPKTYTGTLTEAGIPEIGKNNISLTPGIGLTVTGVGNYIDNIATNAGTMDDPIPLMVTDTLKAATWKALITAIKDKAKYVVLDISASTRGDATTENNNGLDKNWKFTPKSDVPAGLAYIVELKLPALATTIAGGTESAAAFAGYTNLKTVSGAAITAVSDYAFSGLPALTTATFPAATGIGKGAFSDCTALSLTAANFPLVTSISESAFSGCTGLTSVSFPLVESAEIGKNAFQGCTGLTTAAFIQAQKIGEGVFSGCTSLATLNFPEATEIGKSAFNGCTPALSSVSFSKVTTIGENAFEGCASLTTAAFPAATTIKERAFKACNTLTTVTLGATAPATLGVNILEGIPARTITITKPSGATNYGAVPSDTNSWNWGNGFRGMGGTITSNVFSAGSGTVNGGVTLSY